MKSVLMLNAVGYNISKMEVNMDCPNCGRVIKRGVRICRYCGGSVKTSEPKVCGGCKGTGYRDGLEHKPCHGTGWVVPK